MPRPKVLYIAGWGRSGSTLLDQILGEVPGWLSCGELNFVWWNFSCGCGAPVHECAFWSQVLDEVVDGDAARRPEGLVALQREHLDASPRVLAAIRRSRRDRGAGGSPQSRYARVMEDLYEATAAAAGARVIIDSSKTATEAYLLARLAAVELYVVHLVRDPRASAHSWSRRKLKDPSSPNSWFGRLGPTSSSLSWLLRNAVIEALVRPHLGTRYLRLRYEDLMRSPEAAIRSVCSLLGEPEAPLPFLDARTVRLGPNHMVGGNPRRFAAGATEIRSDDEWRTEMPVPSRLLATLPALPLMLRYGYGLSSR